MNCQTSPDPTLPRRPSSPLLLIVLTILGLGVLGLPVFAQDHPVRAGGSYTYVRSNLLPGCRCFGAQGGTAELQIGLTPRLALLGEISVTHQGHLTPDHYALTQSVFSAGLRYTPVRSRAQPFGDLLLGGAHAGGSLSPDNTGLGGPDSFAFQTGGGLLLPLSRRWTLKPFQLNYLLTTFANGANDRQNDLQVSTGVLFRLHR